MIEVWKTYIKVAAIETKQAWCLVPGGGSGSFGLSGSWRVTEVVDI